MIITFDDGKCAVYSASLLHATYPHAEHVRMDVDDEQTLEVIDESSKQKREPLIEGKRCSTDALALGWG